MKYFATLAALVATPVMADQPVTLNFTAEMAGAPVSCSSVYSQMGASKADVKLSDFRLFVHDVNLLRADGSLQPVELEQDHKWQAGNVALLDFEDGTENCTNGTADVNTSLRGSVPEGDYKGVRFKVGLPFDQNHADPTLAPSPLNNTSMFWNWQLGYKFVRIDMVPVEPVSDGSKGWFLHLGSTMCDASSKTSKPEACAHPNLIEVQFDDFDLASQSIVIDPAEVLSGADLLVNAVDTAPGCMSFPADADCSSVMPKLGLAYDGQEPAPQALMQVR